MDDNERDDLLGRLFALLTARLEDGAGLAADGQARRTVDIRRLAIASQLHGIGTAVVTLADTVTALIVDRPPSRPGEADPS